MQLITRHPLKTSANRMGRVSTRNHYGCDVIENENRNQFFFFLKKIRCLRNAVEGCVRGTLKDGVKKTRTRKSSDGRVDVILAAGRLVVITCKVTQTP